MLRGIFANAKDFFNNPDNVLASHPLSHDLSNLGGFLDQLLEARAQPYEQTEYRQEGYYDNYHDANGEYYDHGDYQGEEYYSEYANNENGESAHPESFHETAGGEGQHAGVEKPTIPPIQTATLSSAPVSPLASSPRPAVPAKVANKPRPPPPPPKPTMKSRPDRPNSHIPQGSPANLSNSTSGQSSSPSAAASGSSALTLSSAAFEKGGKVTEEDFIQAILQVHFYSFEKL